MTRLADRLLGRRSLPTPETMYGYMVQSFQSGTTEPVLPTFESYAREGYQGNGIVFGVILARLSLFSQAEFKFQRLSDKSIFGGSELQLLERPWPGGTTAELLARMEQDVSLAGNAFIRSVDGQRLERLRPDLVDIVRVLDEDSMGRDVETVIGYAYYRGGRAAGIDEAEWYAVDEVAHWSPIPDPLATWRGMSWLTPVVREINADTAMNVHKGAFFDNAATPNLAIRYPVKLQKGQIDDLRERWGARYGGASNGWKTAILDEGADLTVIGNSFEQMAFTTVQAAGENRIAAAGETPGIVVGLKEGLAAATYSNYEQAMRKFGDFFGRRAWAGAAGALSKLVTAPVGARLWYDVSGIAALRQGEKDRAETVQILAAAAMNLINAGYQPDSVTKALTSGDMTLLVHTGAIPTALYPDGKAPASTGP